MWGDSPCPPGHDTTASLRTTAPASFKRLLGSRSRCLGDSRAKLSEECVAQVKPQSIALGTPRSRPPRLDVELHCRARFACHAKIQPVTPSANLSIVACERAVTGRPLCRHCMLLSDRIRDYHTQLADRVRLGWRHGDAIRHTDATVARSEEHTSELQSQSNLVCRLLLEKQKKRT